MTTGYLFQELDKEKLLQIYKIIAENQDWKSALDQILIFSRDFFIFDNVAVYLSETISGNIDVVYARATGRGRSKEADVSWGETVGNRVITEKKIIREEVPVNDQVDRLKAPFILGIPLFISEAQAGALVFIRFGGPPYETGSQEFAEFLAVQVTSLVRQKSLDELVIELEKQRTYTALQGDFISTISHEVRNPLGFIRGYTTTLLREDTEWDKKTQKDFLEIIDRETSNLSELIDDLLDSSRLQSGNMRFNFQMLRFDSIIRDEVSRAALNNPGQIFRVEIADSLPAINGDARRIAQVIDNLIDNSTKYAPGAVITIKAYPEDNRLIMEYSDDGPGIDEKYLSLVFSRFFRVPENSHGVRGSGLGLSICKQIIESHNGEMSIFSTKGKGISFRIALPRDANPAKKTKGGN